MGCTQTKKPDTRVEKTLARLNEKEKQLDILIKQHQELILKYETNSLQATQKIPNGSTNELKQNVSVQQNKDQNILPINILDKDDLHTAQKKNIAESNTNEQKYQKSEKTAEKITIDNNFVNNSKTVISHQKANDMNQAIHKDQTASQSAQQTTQYNIVNNLDENNAQNKKISQQQKVGAQGQQSQVLHIIQSEQVYNQNNIIRITEDNEDINMQTDRKDNGRQSKNNQNISKAQPTQRSTKTGFGTDQQKKQNQDEIQEWTNLIQAFDDVSIRPIDNMQDKDQPLSADQIDFELGSKSNGAPTQSPPPFINNIYNTLPTNAQNRILPNINDEQPIQRPKTMQSNQFDQLIHHPDILKIYESVQKKILVKKNEEPQKID
ncbi:hypothetical protein TTHERM_00384770 (macronuclear) [Tetrahymena thermophila SB210]|uniref:Uncharacterized protein n=1 Tax=Tetrahymena thermophila (strain SB210) TaxID=312017 RepID=Q23RL5_TETTS|nr:hypothetical protein TTHERM_00384770 [Tetrahymena thermophila SB210]EAR99033.1 hypothetical protein TTHERM_00384770 [Tetrahymena thermophila SB210]|eukprot:XP_001019278.1 hypothetical protein TTHERM_00384770 [Tetrahymena thermophila SB210]